MFINTKHLREVQNGCVIKYKEVSNENFYNYSRNRAHRQKL
jgi:hypothetical protein